MKEFVVSDLAKFLEISDTIATPFKFLQVEESKTEKGTVIYELKASVWMRTAFLTYEDVGDGDYYHNITSQLKKHGFVLATIREAPMILR